MTTDKELEKILKALANRRRLAIIRFLKKGKPATVTTIAEEIRLSFRSTSKHLAVLAAAGIVEKDQHGLNMYYGIATPLPPIARRVVEIL